MSPIRWSDEGDQVEGGQVRLGLPGDLDLPMAQPLIASLRHAAAHSGSILIDAGGVERVSTACIQALLAASRHAAEHGVRFGIVRPSEVLAEACDDLGLGAWLKQWSDA